MPAKRTRSGVMSEPPPMPVSPTRMPTPRPKRTTSGAIASSGDVEPALGLLGSRTASSAALARLRACRPSDRVVTAVVEGVIGQPALVDARPDVAIRPHDERIVLPHPTALVPLDRLGGGARRRLLAPDAGDPALRPSERALETNHLHVHPAALLHPSAHRRERLFD